MQNRFKKNILNIYGEQGKIWLLNLPNKIQEISMQLGLSKLTPFDNLSYNYVASGLRGAQPIVLKFGIDTDALQREAEALKSFNNGAVNLLLEAKDVLLLEKLNPGNSLKSYFPEADYQAIEIAAKIIQNLHQAPINYKFLHIRDWLKVLDNSYNIPLDLLERARILRDELLFTSSKEVLLHGDLHHYNIIQNGKDWVAIDPKGVIGDPAFEAAAFIINPIPELFDLNDASDIIEKRIIEFSRLLNIDINRIKNWCFVKNILCAVWALEDGLDPNQFINNEFITFN